MMETLYCLWWMIWLCEPKERAIIETRLACFDQLPRTGGIPDDLKKQILRYNRVFYGVRFSYHPWGSKPKRIKRK